MNKVNTESTLAYITRWSGQGYVGNRYTLIGLVPTPLPPRWESLGNTHRVLTQLKTMEYIFTAYSKWMAILNHIRNNQIILQLHS